MMKCMKKILIAGAFFILASCGYQLEGGGYLRENVPRVAVKILENKSFETGADVIFTNALIREILQKTQTRVVDEASATAILSGTIKTVGFDLLSRTNVESVAERNAFTVLDVQMVNKEGEIIWSIKDLTTSSDYRTHPEKVKDEANKSSALEKIAARSAEKIVSRMASNF